jgi:hypothetical protein
MIHHHHIILVSLHILFPNMPINNPPIGLFASLAKISAIPSLFLCFCLYPPDNESPAIVKPGFRNFPFQPFFHFSIFSLHINGGWRLASSLR